LLTKALIFPPFEKITADRANWHFFGVFVYLVDHLQLLDCNQASQLLAA
jgi:hypothetical protein